MLVTRIAKQNLLETKLSITPFGKDEARELNVADLRSNVYRLETPPRDPNTEH